MSSSDRHPPTVDPGLLLLCPLRIEARFVAAGGRRAAGWSRAEVVRTGMGVVRARATAARLTPTARPAAVAGVAGAVDVHRRVGDVVVADQILDAQGRPAGPRLESAGSLAAALREVGLRAVVGAVVTTPRLIHDAAGRRALTDTGAAAVDMESSSVVTAAWQGPLAVVRTISDTPAHRLWSPATVSGGLAALRALSRCTPVLLEWASAGGRLDFPGADMGH